MASQRRRPLRARAARFVNFPRAELKAALAHDLAALRRISGARLHTQIAPGRERFARGINGFFGLRD